MVFKVKPSAYFLTRQSVFWPNHIRQMVKDCELCNRYQHAQPNLPAVQPDLPTRPWKKLGSDIFQFNSANYLIIVHYYSRFPVIRPLNDISASTISSHFTSVFVLLSKAYPHCKLLILGPNLSARGSR